jgi:HK97 family phage portal protein
MTFRTHLESLRGKFGKLIAGKGWREAWARGDDFGGGGAATLSRPYEQSPWVFRAIQHIAGPVSCVPLKWQVMGSNDAAPNDLEREAFWSRPARSVEGTMSRNDFLEGIIAWMNLKGHAFIVMGDDWLAGRRGAESSPLILARPDRMRPIVRYGSLEGWEYTDGANARHLLIPEQVCRPSFYNPYDELEGLAPWKAAEIAAESDYAAGVFARNLMRNNGDQGVYVISKTGTTVDEAQRQQIVAALRQKREANRRGDFRPAFFTADVSVEDPKLKSTDAAFVTQRLENRHEIFIAFGVPASMAEMTVSYSVGAASDRFRLLEETCMPISARIAQHFETIEARRSGKALECVFDWTQHSVMRSVRVEQTNAAKTLFTMGYPLSKSNEWLGLGLPDAPDCLPMNITSASEIVGDNAQEKKDPAHVAADADKKGDDKKPEGDELKSYDKLAALFREMPHACEHEHEHAPEEKANDARTQKWKALMAAREPHVKALRIQVQKAINAAREETLKNLDATKALGEIKRRGVLEIMFDLQKFSLRMWSLIKGPLKTALVDAVEQFGDELGGDDPWTMEDPQVIDFVNSRENRIKDASAEIWQDVRDDLAKGLDQGESNAEIAKRIRAKFTGLSKSRSETIAQTETGAAYGHGRQEAMERSGIAYKEWLTAKDDKVRAEHVRADGQVVAVDEPFTVDGEKLTGPCDSRGSARNVINCRCVAIPVDGPPSQ